VSIPALEKQSNVPERIKAKFPNTWSFLQRARGRAWCFGGPGLISPAPLATEARASTADGAAPRRRERAPVAPPLRHPQQGFHSLRRPSAAASHRRFRRLFAVCAAATGGFSSASSPTGSWSPPSTRVSSSSGRPEVMPRFG
jgi:hypothetical protein